MIPAPDGKYAEVVSKAAIATLNKDDPKLVSELIERAKLELRTYWRWHFAGLIAANSGVLTPGSNQQAAQFSVCLVDALIAELEKE